MIKVLIFALFVVTQVQSFYAPSLPYACAYTNDCKVVRRYQETPSDDDFSRDIFRLVYGNGKTAPPLIHALRSDHPIVPSLRKTLSDMINQIENDIEELAESKDENGERTDLIHDLLDSDYFIRMG